MNSETHAAAVTPGNENAKGGKRAIGGRIRLCVA
jgi:hypothetical protein